MYKEKFAYIFFILVVFLSPALSLASDPGGGPVITDPTMDFVNQLCEFRMMFCGATAVIFVSITAVFIGILILMNKINWVFIIVMIGACTVFVNADKVAFIFTDEDVGCSCV